MGLHQIHQSMIEIVKFVRPPFLLYMYLRASRFKIITNCSLKCEYMYVLYSKHSGASNANRDKVCANDDYLHIQLYI